MLVDSRVDLEYEPIEFRIVRQVSHFGADTAAVRFRPNPVKKTIHFEFSQSLVQQPLLYQLSRLFDVVINIRAASVTERGGFAGGDET